MKRTNFYGRYRSARSLTDRLVHDAIEQSIAYGDEEYEVEVDLPEDLERLWTLVAVTDRIISSAIAVRGVLRGRIAEKIGEGGAVRFGDSLIRYSSSIDRKPLPALSEFLKTRAAETVLAVLPTSNFRVSALRKIAEEHGYDEETLNGTFYLEVRKPPTVTSMPVDHERAPKYASDMKDGEVREGRKR